MANWIHTPELPRLEGRIEIEPWRSAHSRPLFYLVYYVYAIQGGETDRCKALEDHQY